MRPAFQQPATKAPLENHLPALPPSHPSLPFLLAIMSEAKIAELEKKIEALTKHVTRLDDVQEIRKVQHKYGYYIDKCLFVPPSCTKLIERYQQAVGLFADSPEADVKVYFHGGIWFGKEGAKRLYIERFQKTFTHGRNGPRHGFLLDHPMYQDVIDVSEDGKTAQGRFRCNMQAGQHESIWPKEPGARFLPQWWEGYCLN
jgi:SnoaL-like domain